MRPGLRGQFIRQALDIVAPAPGVDAAGRAELRLPDAVGNLYRSSDRGDRRYGPAGELLEARTPDSPIARVVEKRGPGLHHVCIAVDPANAIAEARPST